MPAGTCEPTPSCGISDCGMLPYMPPESIEVVTATGGAPLMEIIVST
nr:hypothetical protein CPGR_05071 [Mycolicibacter nonchromogenicus]